MHRRSYGSRSFDLNQMLRDAERRRIEAELSMLAHWRIWQTLENLPSTTPTSKALPQGKFWLVGPNQHGICAAIPKSFYDSEHIPITYHLQTDLDVMEVKILRLRIVAEIET